MTSRSDWGLTATARSSAAIRSATLTISFRAATIRSNARASTPISSLRDSEAAGSVRSPVAIWLAMPTTRLRGTVMSRMMKKPMTETTSRPSPADASV